MARHEQNYGTGVIFVLLATLGWSLSGVFVRFMPELDGWQINCWRGFWMSVALLVYLVARYGRSTLATFAAVPLAAMVATASFFTVGSTLYVTSLTLLSTATISVIGASSPIFTGLLSPWVTGERPSAIAWLAAIVAVAGVAIIAWDGIGTGRWFGIVIAVLVPISFAGQTLALRRYRSVDMVPAICVGGFVTFVAAGLLGFTAGHASGGFGIGMEHMWLLFLMGPLQLSLPLIFYAWGAKSVAAVTSALIVMLDAVLNPLWPWLIVGEEPQAAAFKGGALIVGAVLLTIFGEEAWRRLRTDRHA